MSTTLVCTDTNDVLTSSMILHSQNGDTAGCDKKLFTLNVEGGTLNVRLGPVALPLPSARCCDAHCGLVVSLAYAKHVVILSEHLLCPDQVPAIHCTRWHSPEALLSLSPALPGVKRNALPSPSRCDSGMSTRSDMLKNLSGRTQKAESAASS